METLRPKVTSKVLQQVQKAPGQKQIAVTWPDGSLAVLIRAANRRDRVRIRIADVLLLELGDTSAIWRSHNDQFQSSFDSLYAFLSRHPDEEFRFTCVIEK